MGKFYPRANYDGEGAREGGGRREDGLSITTYMGKWQKYERYMLFLLSFYFHFSPPSRFPLPLLLLGNPPNYLEALFFLNEWGGIFFEAQREIEILGLRVL